MTVKSSKNYRTDIGQKIYIDTYAIDDTIYTGAAYYYNFYSRDMKCPWIELELDTVTDMSGLEITMSYYAVVQFKDIQIRKFVEKV